MINISRIVHAARVCLGLDVAFVSQFLGNERVFRCVDAAEEYASPIRQGEIGPLEGSYCKLIVEGQLPSVIADVHKDAIVSSLPGARDSQVGSHIGVPIRLSDGSIYGTFCCFSGTVRPTLGTKDLAALEAFAELAATGIEQDLLSEQSVLRKEQRIRTAMASLGPKMVYQPVFMLDDLRPIGAEALARFPGHGDIPIDVWFKDAADVGLQAELELSAVANALAQFRPIWATHRVQLGLNVSPGTLLDERLWHLLDGAPRELIVLELTEHEQVRDYPALLEATDRLRERGTKIAVDDVGAGFASMQHVLKLRPNILKLDLSLTRSIDTDELKHALASSLKHFADRFSCKIIAEGVETPEELETLQKLGLQGVQGYLLARPGSADDFKALLDQAKTPVRRDLPKERSRAGRSKVGKPVGVLAV